MNIQQLSHEVGIGIDTLRIWERRYGFPQPTRDTRGHRLYPADQIEELRTIKKLLTLGCRPGKVLQLSLAERDQFLVDLTRQDKSQDTHLIELLQLTKPKMIEQRMKDRLNRLGLEQYIKTDVLPLLDLLDQGWTDGSISIAREHLVSDALERVLIEQIQADTPDDSMGKMLFLTLSGETHKIGLLLSAALFKQQRVTPVLLLRELPVSEVPQLARDLDVMSVALSFSAHYSPPRAKKDLALLRNSLDSRIKLFAGGHAVQNGVSMQNLFICSDLFQIPELCRKQLGRA